MLLGSEPHGTNDYDEAASLIGHREPDTAWKMRQKQSVCLGLSNRLPYFINYFFDTYLLINEDTPVESRSCLPLNGARCPCVKKRFEVSKVLHSVLVGSSVTQLLARDLDNDPLVFGVVGEEASRFFAVESMTGVIWLRQPLDRETKSEFTVEFSVSDSQGVIKGSVNIQVGDVNDNTPRFHNQPYSVRIPEGHLNAALKYLELHQLFMIHRHGPEAEKLLFLVAKVFLATYCPTLQINSGQQAFPVVKEQSTIASLELPQKHDKAGATLKSKKRLEINAVVQTYLC
ncbi:hypothetical protein L345_00319, partial [Ophiophagus hannah]